jgi:ribose/xylose/arabinose/galactoside ABC-type transport system permease subunit
MAATGGQAMRARGERAAAPAAAVTGWLSANLIWAVLAAAVALLALTLEPFWTASNGLNVLRQVAIMGLLAVGVTLVLVAGHFDLSVGATLTLAAVLAIKMQPVDAAGTMLAIAVPLAAGLLVGAVNGGLVGLLGANSIIVTVGMQLVLGGTTLMLVAGQHVRVDGAAPAFVAIGAGSWAGVPLPVWLMLAAVLAGHLLLAHTRAGRHLKAIGGNATAARMVGIAVGRRVLMAYMLSGALAALAGIVVAARVRNLDPTSGAGYELAALTAVVLGGTRLTGGHGSMLRTLAGVLLLGVVANAMRLLDLSYSLQLLLQGLVLLAAVAFEARLQGDRR